MLSTILSFGAAATLVAAWLLPLTSIGAALSWTSVVLWIASFKDSRRVFLRSYLAGCLTYAGGFYWLYSTIADFGGFPSVAALAIFALFVFGSAIQFLIFAFAYRFLPAIFSKLGMRAAIAWLIAQHFWIRIFPWDFGHSQIAFLQFAQIADIGGVQLITFIMFWFVESFVTRQTSVLSRALALVALLLSTAYGFVQIDKTPKLYGPSLHTVTIQGNMSLEQQRGGSSDAGAMFAVNRERYDKISRESSRSDALIIWPESTITDFVPDDISDAKRSKLLPYIGDGSAYLVGGLSYRDQKTFFNTSFLIKPNGEVPAPYHKMILMPFGEYTPLGDLFPFIKEINATAAQFTPGVSPAVLEYTTTTGTDVKLSPLICYEDIVPVIGRDAVRLGAQLLINQTNDAWFGNTHAASQHHMIASFRAIENRRFLIRATNTGLTAVVDPTGNTLFQLPTYSEGVLEMPVNLLSVKTLYTQWNVEGFWWFLSVSVFLGSALYLKKNARQKLGS